MALQEYTTLAHTMLNRDGSTRVQQMPTQDGSTRVQEIATGYALVSFSQQVAQDKIQPQLDQTIRLSKSSQQQPGYT